MLLRSVSQEIGYFWGSGVSVLQREASEAISTHSHLVREQLSRNKVCSSIFKKMS